MKAARAAIVLGVLSAACSGAPAPSATLAPTPASTPSASLTAPPTPTASPTLTLAPTASPTPASSPSASPTQGGTPSASPATELDELFRDDFSDPASGWGVGQVGDSGSIAYIDGALQLRNEAGATGVQSLWSRRAFGSGPHTAARLEASIVADAAGIGGLMCGSGGDEFLGMLLSTDGRWFALHLSSTSGASELRVLDSGSYDGELFVVGEPLDIVVACAIVGSQISIGLAAGSPATQVALFVGDSPVTGFDRAGIYAEGLALPYTQRVDDFVAQGGQAPGDPLQAELLGHIPAAYRTECQETPVSASEPGALLAIACFLSDGSGPGAEVVEYVLFEDGTSMDAAYDARLAAWGGQSAGASCREGPAASSYTANGEQLGRVFCGLQGSLIRMDWTDERLNILTSATDFDSVYAELYETWQQAGPNP